MRLAELMTVLRREKSSGISGDEGNTSKSKSKSKSRISCLRGLKVGLMKEGRSASGKNSIPIILLLLLLILLLRAFRSSARAYAHRRTIIRALLPTSSQNRPACEITAILEDLPLIRSGQLGDHRAKAIARVMRMTNGNGPAPVGIFPEPPAFVPLGIASRSST